MRILLTTINDNTNIGTFLQIYATISTFQKKGHQVTLLNYIRSYLLGRQYALNIWKDRNFIIRHLFALYFALKNKCVRNKTKSFLYRAGIKMTKKYDSFETISKRNWDYDLYVTGSDQVWNVMHNHRLDKVFFLTFVHGHKISYAASIGLDEIPEKFREEIKQYLSDYDFISVREDTSINLLESMGINNVKHVLDPTLLLTKKDWSLISHKENFNNHKPFLLIYSVENENNDLLNKIAHEIAREKGYLIYQILSSKKNHHNTLNADQYFEECSPELFIHLFLQTDFAVVSSFHGTAFAINFEKQFLTIAPSRFNSRVMSLLRIFNLESRYIDNETIPLDKIDYAPVSKKLDSLRDTSEHAIDKAIESVQISINCSNN